MAGLTSLMNAIRKREAACPSADCTIAEPEFKNEYKSFSRLPREIRWLIWELALPDPEFVTLYTLTRITSPLTLCPKYFKAAYRAPVLLRVNQESRSVTQKDYLFLPPGGLGLENGMCFDWKSDAVYFSDNHALGNFCRHVHLLAKQLPVDFKMRYVIIEINIFRAERETIFSSLEVLKAFGMGKIVIRAEMDDGLRNVFKSVRDYAMPTYRRLMEQEGTSLPGPEVSFELMTGEEMDRDLEHTYYPGSEPSKLVPVERMFPEGFRPRVADERWLFYWASRAMVKMNDALLLPLGMDSLVLRRWLM